MRNRVDSLTGNRYNSGCLEPFSLQEGLMKSVNIQDIAREAGVGKATVSRVINGKGYVSRDTAAKIRAVMERYHY